MPRAVLLSRLLLRGRTASLDSPAVLPEIVRAAPGFWWARKGPSVPLLRMRVIAGSALVAGVVLVANGGLTVAAVSSPGQYAGVVAAQSATVTPHLAFVAAAPEHSVPPTRATAPVAASRSAPRGVDVDLRCPTTAAPGCDLAFIKDDAGLRIHPVYGYRSCHTGIDLRGREGAPVLAAAAGRVIRVIRGDRAYGNVTLIQVDGQLRTMYAHQSQILVEVGERVEQGQVIGRVGSTGFATGPHLHFEVHVNGHPYDPAGWFGGKKRPVSCYPGVKY